MMCHQSFELQRSWYRRYQDNKTLSFVSLKWVFTYG